MSRNRYFHLSNMNFNINQLCYFVTAAETLSFSRAAEILYVPQSAVSQKILQLENKLQIRLFVRTNRAVSLTSAGKEFYGIAIKMLSEAEEAVGTMKAADAGMVGMVNIGFLAGPVLNFLPNLINQFKESFPRILINLKHLTQPELIEDLQTDKLDIVFAVPLGFGDARGVESRLIYSSDIGVYASKKSALAKHERLTPEQMRGIPFIMRERGEFPQWHDYIIDLCIKNGFYPKIVHNVKRLEPLMIFVASGVGISVFPQYLSCYAPDSVAFLPLSMEGNQIEIRAYRKTDCANPAAHTFYNHVC